MKFSVASGNPSDEELVALHAVLANRKPVELKPVIKRSVFERMEKHFPELDCVNDHQNRDFEKYHACFDCMIDPVTRRYLSEDYAFCRRWQQMGGKIFADVHTTLGHVGNLPFSGCMDDRLKAKTPSVATNEPHVDSSDKEQSVPREDAPHPVAA